jgi:hypothetical protein
MIKDEEFEKKLAAERQELLAKAKEAREAKEKPEEKPKVEPKESYPEGQTVLDTDLIALYKINGVRKVQAISIEQFHEFTKKKPFKDCYSMQIYRTDLSKYAVLSW